MAGTHEGSAWGSVPRRTIVVGLADDAASWAALDWALARAAREGAAVRAVRAVPAGDPDGLTTGCSGGSDRLVVEVEDGALRRLAARAARAVGVRDAPPVSLSWSRGRGRDVLVAAAVGADAVVVGRPVHLGRTVRALLERVACPVTAVDPGDAPTEETAGGRNRHVVVGVDASAGPSGETEASLAEALRRTRDGDRVTVVAGFDPAPVRSDWPRGYRPTPTVDEQLRTVREATRALVDPAVERCRRAGADRGVTVDVIAWPEEPRRAVLGAARSLRADEVLVPRGGVWSPRALWRLVRTAPCAVTAVSAPLPVETPVTPTITPPRSAPARGDVAVSGAGAH
ncbi:MAG: hypothetical protein K0S40_3908 [Actinomycetospora sp.]|jgi:hypothetical protein|nr:hypothetical protein [Actinomycetospora sp.]